MSIPDSALAQIDAANRLAESKRFTEAEALYQNSQQALEAAGSPPSSFFHLFANYALLHLETGKDAAALPLFQKALAIEPAWFQGHYNIANAYDNLGEEALALQHYLAAYKLDPADVDCLNNLALTCMHAGKLNDAQKYCASALRLDKSNASILLTIGQVYAKMNNIKRALFFLSKSLSLSPSNTTLLCLADVHLQRKDRTSAISCMKQALGSSPEPDPNPNPNPGHVRLKTECDGYKETDRLEQQEIHLDLNSIFSLASLCVLDGQEEEAISLLERTAKVYRERHPEDSIGHKLFGIVSGLYAGDNECSNDNRMTEEAFLKDYNEQELLSTACEAFLLHTSMVSPDVLAHKVKVALALQRAGQRGYIPETYICETAQDVHEQLQSHGKDDLWYLKDPAVQRGQGIRLVDRKDPVESLAVIMSSKRRYCLQRGVKPLLLNGRKFGIRMHVFVIKPRNAKVLQVHASNDGILTLCGTEFDESSRALLAHITCTSVQRSEPGYDKAKVKGPASRMWAAFEATLPQIRTAVASTISAVAKALVREDDASEADNHNEAFQCQLFGYDFLVDDTGRPLFIEANVVPQFQHAKTFEDREVIRRLVNGFPIMLCAQGSLSGSNPLWDFVAAVPC